MRYRPITNKYTKSIVQIIKENIEFCNKARVTVDTGDICHLLGRIKQLEESEAYYKDYKQRIDKAIKMLEESQKGLEEWHFDSYDPCLEEIINILKGGD